MYVVWNGKYETERNPLSVREKLFNPNIKMIFQSKMLSDMADVDGKSMVKVL